MRFKIIRITTVPISMNIILRDQLKFINQFYEVIGVTGYDEKHFNEIAKREGIRLHAIKMSRSISIFNDFASLWKLYIVFRKEKPAIVHTHTPKAGFLGLLAALFAKVPVRLHTVAGMPLLETRGVKRKLLNIIERITYACAHKVYPNSHGLKSIILENRFCSNNKLKVIGNGSSNGINASYFSPSFTLESKNLLNEIKSQYKIEDSDFVFCFVGRLAKEKGISELVEAFEHVSKYNRTGLKLRLLLVGPFENHYGKLEEDTYNKILSNLNILTVGRHDDIRPFLALSNVFVFPSYREGFPGAVLQAGAMGLPCIVTNINGCNEIIRHHVNGLIIEPKSIIQLQNAMLNVLEEPQILKNLASKARKIVVENFSREFIWKEILKEYNDQIDAKKNNSC